MTRVLALTRRELLAYFYAPVPYLVLFFFLLLLSYFFQGVVHIDPRTGRPGAFVSFETVFQVLAFLIMFLIPLLTMNSVAEEKARNTIETLLTAPVGDWQVIFSKWLGTMAFYLVMLAPTAVFMLILRNFGSEIGKPDAGAILGAYAGALLLGSFYVAIGVFASSLTEDALLSAFVALVTIIAFLAPDIIVSVVGSDEQWLKDTTRYLTQTDHFSTFLQGRIGLHDVLYFVIGTALFLFGAVRALESRRWR